MSKISTTDASAPSMPLDQGFIDRRKLEFASDLLDMRLRKNFGHMAQYMYGGPEFEGDRVNGAQSWIDYLNDSSVDRSSIASELANRGSQILPQYVTEPVALAFIGAGDVIRFRQNDLTLVEQFIQASSPDKPTVVSATVYDSSPVFVQDCLTALSETPGIERKSGTLQDVFTGFDIPGNGRGNRTESPTKIATMFGRTMFNLPGAIEDGLPKDILLERAKTIRHAVGKGGIFALEYASGPLKEASYEPQIEFAKNLGEVINRDTPQYKVDTDKTNIAFRYNAEHGVMGHYITLSGPAWEGEEEYHYNSTWVTPNDTLIPILKKAGFASVFDMDDSGVTKRQNRINKKELTIDNSTLGLFVGV